MSPFNTDELRFSKTGNETLISLSDRCEMNAKAFNNKEQTLFLYNIAPYKMQRHIINHEQFPTTSLKPAHSSFSLAQR